MKITEVLVMEHRIFLGVFEHIERALPGLTTPAEVRTLAGLIEGLLEDHAGMETDLAYLALDHVLQDRGQLDRLHQDHHEIDAALREARRAGDCAEARRLLQAAIQATRQHMRLEEQSVFPLLERVLQDETLTELAAAWPRRSAPPPAPA